MCRPALSGPLPFALVCSVMGSWAGCVTYTVGFLIISALQMAANPIDDLNTVLETCGITVAAQRASIINTEGFTQISDLAVLDGDTDVLEMAKRLANHTAAAGCVTLGTVQIKNLQALVYWVRDLVARDEDIDAADWTPAMMETARARKRVAKAEQDDKAPDVDDLKKFKPNQFEEHEDAFKNVLAQTNGSRGFKLRYVVRPDDAPGDHGESEGSSTRSSVMRH